ncbi:hypothetical protein SESBI_50961, partial [Sesbania bispinosa]
MTLLEHFKEALLRLMMFSALSKATTTDHGCGERQRPESSPWGEGLGFTTESQHSAAHNVSPRARE